MMHWISDEDLVDASYVYFCINLFSAGSPGNVTLVAKGKHAWK